MTEADLAQLRDLIRAEVFPVADAVERLALQLRSPAAPADPGQKPTDEPGSTGPGCTGS